MADFNIQLKTRSPGATFNIQIGAYVPPEPPPEPSYKIYNTAHYYRMRRTKDDRIL